MGDCDLVGSPDAIKTAGIEIWIWQPDWVHADENDSAWRREAPCQHVDVRTGNRLSGFYPSRYYGVIAGAGPSECFRGRVVRRVMDAVMGDWAYLYGKRLAGGDESGPFGVHVHKLALDGGTASEVRSRLETLDSRSWRGLPMWCRYPDLRVNGESENCCSMVVKILADAGALPAWIREQNVHEPEQLFRALEELVVAGDSGVSRIWSRACHNPGA